MDHVAKQKLLKRRKSTDAGIELATHHRHLTNQTTRLQPCFVDWWRTNIYKYF